MKTIKILIILMSLAFVSCDSKPTKVEPLNNTGDTDKKSNLIKENGGLENNRIAKDFHEVLVIDSLMTDRYLYLNVNEGAKNYWISTWKMPVNIGDKLYYENGILKLNFYSKEQKRFYDTLFLVSRIAKSPFINKKSIVNDVIAKNKDDVINNSKLFKKNLKNIIPLKEIITNSESYKDKIIDVAGKCIKVNINIMGKNWIHIQQQDDNGEKYELVVTSQEKVKVGEDCVFKGEVKTKIDLGAGYFYDVIVQDAKRIY